MIKYTERKIAYLRERVKELNRKAKKTGTQVLEFLNKLRETNS